MISRFWIVAGANGSGKTTFVRRGDVQALIGSIELLNPDDLALTIMRANPRLDANAANLEAARRTQAKVESLIESGQSLLVETVLSTDKYMASVLRARERGYEIAMIYLALSKPEYAIDRVRNRVRRGGHDVPEDKIRTRWKRSHQMLARFAPLMDLLLVYSNDPGADAILVARKVSKEIEILRPGLLPEIDRAFE